MDVQEHRIETKTGPGPGASPLGETRASAARVTVFVPSHEHFQARERSLWHFSRLFSTVSDPRTDRGAENTRPRVLSVTPRPAKTPPPSPSTWAVDGRTEVHFVYAAYRVLFVLDLSPSAAAFSPDLGDAPCNALCDVLERKMQELLETSARLAQASAPHVIYVSVACEGSAASPQPTHVLVDSARLTRERLPELVAALRQRISRQVTRLVEEVRLALLREAAAAARALKQHGGGRTAATRSRSRLGDARSALSPLLTHALGLLEAMPRHACPVVVVLTDGVQRLAPETHDQCFDALVLADAACSVQRVGGRVRGLATPALWWHHVWPFGFLPDPAPSLSLLAKNNSFYTSLARRSVFLTAPSAAFRAPPQGGARTAAPADAEIAFLSWLRGMMGAVRGVGDASANSGDQGDGQQAPNLGLVRASAYALATAPIHLIHSRQIQGFSRAFGYRAARDGDRTGPSDAQDLRLIMVNRFTRAIRILYVIARAPPPSTASDRKTDRKTDAPVRVSVFVAAPKRLLQRVRAALRDVEPDVQARGSRGGGGSQRARGRATRAKPVSSGRRSARKGMAAPDARVQRLLHFIREIRDRDRVLINMCKAVAAVAPPASRPAATALSSYSALWDFLSRAPHWSPWLSVHKENVIFRVGGRGAPDSLPLDVVEGAAARLDVKTSATAASQDVDDRSTTAAIATADDQSSSWREQLIKAVRAAQNQLVHSLAEWATIAYQQSLFVRVLPAAVESSPDETVSPSVSSSVSSSDHSDRMRVYLRAMDRGAGGSRAGGICIVRATWITNFIAQITVGFFNTAPAARIIALEQLRKHVAETSLPAGGALRVLDSDPAPGILAEKNKIISESFQSMASMGAAKAMSASLREGTFAGLELAKDWAWTRMHADSTDSGFQELVRERCQGGGFSLAATAPLSRVLLRELRLSNGAVVVVQAAIVRHARGGGLHTTLRVRPGRRKGAVDSLPLSVATPQDWAALCQLVFSRDLSTLSALHTFDCLVTELGAGGPPPPQPRGASSTDGGRGGDAGGAGSGATPAQSLPAILTWQQPGLDDDASRSWLKVRVPCRLSELLARSRRTEWDFPYPEVLGAVPTTTAQAIAQTEAVIQAEGKNGEENDKNKLKSNEEARLLCELRGALREALARTAARALQDTRELVPGRVLATRVRRDDQCVLVTVLEKPPADILNSDTKTGRLDPGVLEAERALAATVSAAPLQQQQQQQQQRSIRITQFACLRGEMGQSVDEDAARIEKDKTASASSQVGSKEGPLPLCAAFAESEDAGVRGTGAADAAPDLKQPTQFVDVDSTQPQIQDKKTTTSLMSPDAAEVRENVRSVLFHSHRRAFIRCVYAAAVTLKRVTAVDFAAAARGCIEYTCDIDISALQDQAPASSAPSLMRVLSARTPRTAGKAMRRATARRARFGSSGALDDDGRDIVIKSGIFGDIGVSSDSKGTGGLSKTPSVESLRSLADDSSEGPALDDPSSRDLVTRFAAVLDSFFRPVPGAEGFYYLDAKKRQSAHAQTQPSALALGDAGGFEAGENKAQLASSEDSSDDDILDGSERRRFGRYGQFEGRGTADPNNTASARDAPSSGPLAPFAYPVFLRLRGVAVAERRAAGGRNAKEPPSVDVDRHCRLEDVLERVRKASLVSPLSATTGSRVVLRVCCLSLPPFADPTWDGGRDDINELRRRGPGESEALRYFSTHQRLRLRHLPAPPRRVMRKLTSKLKALVSEKTLESLRRRTPVAYPTIKLVQKHMARLPAEHVRNLLLPLEFVRNGSEVTWRDEEGENIVGEGPSAPEAQRLRDITMKMFAQQLKQNPFIRISFVVSPKGERTFFITSLATIDAKAVLQRASRPGTPSTPNKAGTPRTPGGEDSPVWRRRSGDSPSSIASDTSAGKPATRGAIAPARQGEANQPGLPAVNPHWHRRPSLSVDVSTATLENGAPEAPSSPPHRYLLGPQRRLLRSKRELAAVLQKSNISKGEVGDFMEWKPPAMTPNARVPPLALGSDAAAVSAAAPPRIPFWILMSVNSNDELEVSCCTLGLSETVLEATLLMVRQAVECSCRRVNQLQLLESLYDTRRASEWLVPAPPKPMQLLHATGRVIIQGRFKTGEFRCPVRCRVGLQLHRRVDRGSIIQEMRKRTLRNLSVQNRDNLFVLKEQKTGRIFYLLFERQGDAKKDKPPRGDKANEATVSEATVSDLPPDEASLVLAVCGVQRPSKEITSKLSQYLETQIRSMVVSEISILLSRNPRARLESYDIDFLRPNGASAASALLCTPQIPVKDPYLWCLYVKQNIAQFASPLRLRGGGGGGGGAGAAPSLGKTKILKRFSAATPVQIRPLEFAFVFNSGSKEALSALATTDTLSTSATGAMRRGERPGGSTAASLRSRAPRWVPSVQERTVAREGLAVVQISLVKTDGAKPARCVPSYLAMPPAARASALRAGHLDALRRLGVTAPGKGPALLSSAHSTIVDVTPAENFNSDRKTYAGGGWRLLVETWIRGDVDLPALQERLEKGVRKGTADFFMEVVLSTGTDNYGPSLDRFSSPDLSEEVMSEKAGAEEAKVADQKPQNESKPSPYRTMFKSEVLTPFRGVLKWASAVEAPSVRWVATELRLPRYALPTLAERVRALLRKIMGSVAAQLAVREKTLAAQAGRSSAAQIDDYQMHRYVMPPSGAASSELRCATVLEPAVSDMLILGGFAAPFAEPQSTSTEGNSSRSRSASAAGGSDREGLTKRTRLQLLFNPMNVRIRVATTRGDGRSSSDPSSSPPHTALPPPAVAQPTAADLSAGPSSSAPAAPSAQPTSAESSQPGTPGSKARARLSPVSPPRGQTDVEATEAIEAAPLELNATVSRRCASLVRLGARHLEVCLYNWRASAASRFIAQIEQALAFLRVRNRFFISVIHQKLGLFDHFTACVPDPPKLEPAASQSHAAGVESWSPSSTMPDAPGSPLHAGATSQKPRALSIDVFDSILVAEKKGVFLWKAVATASNPKPPADIAGVVSLRSGSPSRTARRSSRLTGGAYLAAMLARNRGGPLRRTRGATGGGLRRSGTGSRGSSPLLQALAGPNSDSGLAGRMPPKVTSDSVLDANAAAAASGQAAITGAVMTTGGGAVGSGRAGGGKWMPRAGSAPALSSLALEGGFFHGTGGAVAAGAAAGSPAFTAFSPLPSTSFLSPRLPPTGRAASTNLLFRRWQLLPEIRERRWLARGPRKAKWFSHALAGIHQWMLGDPDMAPRALAPPPPPAEVETWHLRQMRRLLDAQTAVSARAVRVDRMRLLWSRSLDDRCAPLQLSTARRLLRATFRPVCVNTVLLKTTAPRCMGGDATRTRGPARPLRMQMLREFAGGFAETLKRSLSTRRVPLVEPSPSDAPSSDTTDAAAGGSNAASGDSGDTKKASDSGSSPSTPLHLMLFGRHVDGVNCALEFWFLERPEGVYACLSSHVEAWPTDPRQGSPAAAPALALARAAHLTAFARDFELRWVAALAMRRGGVRQIASAHVTAAAPRVERMFEALGPRLVPSGGKSALGVASVEVRTRHVDVDAAALFQRLCAGAKSYGFTGSLKHLSSDEGLWLRLPSMAPDKAVTYLALAFRAPVEDRGGLREPFDADDEIATIRVKLFLLRVETGVKVSGTGRGGALRAGRSLADARAAAKARRPLPGGETRAQMERLRREACVRVERAVQLAVTHSLRDAAWASVTAVAAPPPSRKYVQVFEQLVYRRALSSFDPALLRFRLFGRHPSAWQGLFRFLCTAYAPRARTFAGSRAGRHHLVVVNGDKPDLLLHVRVRERRRLKAPAKVAFFACRKVAPRGPSSGRVEADAAEAQHVSRFVNDVVRYLMRDLFRT